MYINAFLVQKCTNKISHTPKLLRPVTSTIQRDAVHNNNKQFKKKKDSKRNT